MHLQIILPRPRLRACSLVTNPRFACFAGVAESSHDLQSHCSPFSSRVECAGLGQVARSRRTASHRRRPNCFSGRFCRCRGACRRGRCEAGARATCSRRGRCRGAGGIPGRGLGRGTGCAGGRRWPAREGDAVGGEQVLLRRPRISNVAQQGARAARASPGSDLQAVRHRHRQLDRLSVW